MTRNYSKIFKALSDPNRLRIIMMLQVRPLCVCEIQSVLKLAPSTVSKHLSILRDAGFIYAIKENKWVNYYLDDKTGDSVIRELQKMVKEYLSRDDVFSSDRQKVLHIDRNKVCGV